MPCSIQPPRIWAVKPSLPATAYQAPLHAALTSRSCYGMSNSSLPNSAFWREGAFHCVAILSLSSSFRKGKMKAQCGFARLIIYCRASPVAPERRCGSWLRCAADWGHLGLISAWLLAWEVAQDKSLLASNFLFINWSKYCYFRCLVLWWCYHEKDCMRRVFFINFHYKSFWFWTELLPL